MSKDYSCLNGMKANENSKLNIAYDKGYKAGYEDGKTSLYPTADEKIEETHQAGMERVWRALECWCDMSNGMRDQIFGCHRTKYLVDVYKPIDVIEKINNYQNYLSSSEKPNKSDNIKVGDEVEIYYEHGKHKAVITGADVTDTGADYKET